MLTCKLLRVHGTVLHVDSISMNSNLPRGFSIIFSFNLKHNFVVICWDINSNQLTLV